MAASDYIRASNGLGEAVRANISQDRPINDMQFITDSVLNFPAKFIGTAATLGSDGILVNMTVFFGYLAGGIIYIDHFAPGYTDVGNLVNQVIVIKPNSAWADAVYDTIQGAGTAADVATAAALSANTAATSATSATTATVSATTNANTATAAANTATTATNTAKTNAITATTNANTATTSANTAATSANTAATAANTAAAAIAAQRVTMKSSQNASGMSLGNFDYDLGALGLPTLSFVCASPCKASVSVDMSVFSASDFEFRPEIRLGGAIVKTFSPRAAAGHASRAIAQRGFTQVISLVTGTNIISAGVLLSSSTSAYIDICAASISATVVGDAT